MFWSFPPKGILALLVSEWEDKGAAALFELMRAFSSSDLSFDFVFLKSFSWPRISDNLMLVDMIRKNSCVGAFVYLTHK